jgi:hypothetical protein
MILQWPYEPDVARESCVYLCPLHVHGFLDNNLAWERHACDVGNARKKLRKEVLSDGAFRMGSATEGS